MKGQKIGPKPTKAQDKLMQARRAKQRTFTLPECKVEVELRKWNLNQILQHSGLLMEVVKDLAASTDPQAIAKFLSMDVSKILGVYRTKIYGILSNTLWYSYKDEGETIEFLDNFDVQKEADAFVRELGPGDLMALVHEIYKDNFSPLAERLGLSGKSPAEIWTTLQAMKTPTSSTN